MYIIRLVVIIIVWRFRVFSVPGMVTARDQTHSPSRDLRNAIALIARTWREGLIWQQVQRNRTVESMVSFLDLSRKTNRISVFRHKNWRGLDLNPGSRQTKARFHHLGYRTSSIWLEVPIVVAESGGTAVWRCTAVVRWSGSKCAYFQTNSKYVGINLYRFGINQTIC
jgi:hypothetical protein